MSSHHWCILSHVKTRNSDTGHKHSQHSFLHWYWAGLNWEEKHVKASYRLVCGDTQTKVTRQAVLFGEHIPTITLSNQPTSGAWLTCDLEIPEDLYKLCLRAGKAQGIWPKRHWGTKSSAKCQRILQEHLCRWQGLESHQAAHAGHGPWAGHSIALQCRPASSPGRGSAEPAGSLTGAGRSHRLAQSSDERLPPAAASALAHICSYVPGGGGHAGMPWGYKHGEGAPLTYFSYSALSRSQRESLCFCQSLPCLQVVRRTTSSPLWTWYKAFLVSDPIPVRYLFPLNTNMYFLRGGMVLNLKNPFSPPVLGWSLEKSGIETSKLGLKFSVLMLALASIAWPMSNPTSSV